MPEPGVHSEGETLSAYLGEQLQAIRNAAHGLSEEQARATPCRSSLSVGGLVKHATYVMAGLDDRLAGRPRDASAPQVFFASFALGEDETLAGVLATFDARRATYLAQVAAIDPGATSLEPAAPWHGRPEPTTIASRFFLVHHVEEFARHAGHADILREQLDGAAALPLAMAVDGVPGNDFVQPWTPSAE